MQLCDVGELHLIRYYFLPRSTRVAMCEAGTVRGGRIGRGGRTRGKKCSKKNTQHVAKQCFIITFVKTYFCGNFSSLYLLFSH